MSKFVGRVELSDHQTLEVWASKGRIEFHNVETEVEDSQASLSIDACEKLCTLLQNASAQAYKMALVNEDEKE